MWHAVCRLKPDYRCAYLLNIPAPGKSRGDIEVFVLNGIASVAEIGAALGLSDAQFEILWGALELDAADRAILFKVQRDLERWASGNAPEGSSNSSASDHAGSR